MWGSSRCGAMAHVKCGEVEVTALWVWCGAIGGKGGGSGWMELLLQRLRSRSSSACSLWGRGWQSTATPPHPPPPIVLLWDIVGSLHRSMCCSMPSPGAAGRRAQPIPGCHQRMFGLLFAFLHNPPSCPPSVLLWVGGGRCEQQQSAPGCTCEPTCARTPVCPCAWHSYLPLCSRGCSLAAHVPQFPPLSPPAVQR